MYRLANVLPDFAEELHTGFLSLRRPDLAEQVWELLIYPRFCPCGCSSIHTIDPDAPVRPRTLLSPDVPGLYTVSVIAGQITQLEILGRDDLREKLARIYRGSPDGHLRTHSDRLAAPVTFANLDIAPRFWHLIDAARGDTRRMRWLLNRLGLWDLARFGLEFDLAVDDLLLRVFPHGDERLEDEEIAAWVVSRGLATFAAIYDHPARFPREMPDWTMTFLGLAEAVYEDRFEDVLPADVGLRWRRSLGRLLAPS
jgi:hypothetical protein